MKQLVCEMCGGKEFTKQDGFLVCESCGLKYSVEEARKIMVEGTVDVQGTVKVDNTEEVKKLYQAARNARETSDTATALRHYESISAKDPDSWEALFYLAILKTHSIKNGEIASAAIRVCNRLDRVFQLIKESIPEGADRKSAVAQVIEQCHNTAVWLTSASHDFYKSVTKGTGVMALTGVTGIISSLAHTGNAVSEDQDRCFKIAKLMGICGNGIEIYFDMQDADYKQYAVWCWKTMLNFNADYKKIHASDLFGKDALATYLAKIGKYDPDYLRKEEEKKVVAKQEQKARSKKGLKIMLMLYLALIPIIGVIANIVVLCMQRKKPKEERFISTGVSVLAIVLGLIISLCLSMVMVLV